MAGGSNLFGVIAVDNKFITESQLQEAIQQQESLLGMGVKKRLGDILKEKGWMTEHQVQLVIREQSISQGRRDARDFGRLAVQNGFIDDGQLREALGEQRVLFSEQREMIPLASLLMRKGLLQEQQNRAILRQMNRQQHTEPEISKESSVLYGVRECPICAALSPVKAETCGGCGAYLGEKQLRIKCKSCGEEQAQSSEFCTHCGANLVTGGASRESKVHPCEGCGTPLPMEQRLCLECLAKLPEPLTQRMVKTAKSGTVFVVKMILAMAILIAVPTSVILLAHAGDKFKEAARTLIKGKRMARLEGRGEALAEALQALNYGMINELASRETAGRFALEVTTSTRGQQIRKLALGGVEADAEVEEYSIQESSIDGNKGKVTMEIKFKKALQLPGLKLKKDDNSEASQVVVGANTKTALHTFAWSFLYVDEDWWFNP